MSYLMRLGLAPKVQGAGRPRGRDARTKKRRRETNVSRLLEMGGDLLSRGRSTIGAGGLNFSVRNGKRWGPAAKAARVALGKWGWGNEFPREAGRNHGNLSGN